MIKALVLLSAAMFGGGFVLLRILGASLTLPGYAAAVMVGLGIGIVDVVGFIGMRELHPVLREEPRAPLFGERQR